MANLADRIEAELDNIQEVLDRIPPSEKLSSVTELELAGVATLLHNFYNGIENILKQSITSKGVRIPQGQTWHRDLLDLALKHKVIHKATWESLKQFLAFRHFFNHSYAFYLEANRLRPLVKSAPNSYKSFKKDIMKFLK